MELEFQQSDFKNLMFPVLSMPDNIDPVKHFEKLKRWEEFHNTKLTDIKKNKIFKYIVLMYDKNSPFRDKVSDLFRRKVEIAKFIKLIKDPNSIPDETLSILKGDNMIVNRMVVAYVRMHRDSLYSLIVGLDKMFYNNLLQVESNEKPQNSLTQVQEDLENKVLELLNRDNTPKLATELFTYMEEERLSLFRPEGIAESLSENKDPFEGKDFDYGIDQSN